MNIEKGLDDTFKWALTYMISWPIDILKTIYLCEILKTKITIHTS